MDMNFTTLIMLIFTAILAIGLVSKGLRTLHSQQGELFCENCHNLYKSSSDLGATY